MRNFDALDPALALYENHFIEASAGTGKTFAIENIILRFLSDPNGPQIDEILVVTFTKAAVAELKSRIRANIEASIMKFSDEKIQRRLKNALLLFDEAKIFTIHGFCFHTLKENSLAADFYLDQQADCAQKQQCLDILKDYLRTNDCNAVGPCQLEKIIKMHEGNVDLLLEKLGSIILNRLPVKHGKPYQELIGSLQLEILNLKNAFSIESEKLYEDLLAQAPLFKKICNKKMQVPLNYALGFKKFASLFDHFHEDLLDLPILKMKEDQLKAKSKAPDHLHYPGLLVLLQQNILPLLSEISDPYSILALLAEKGRVFFEKAICGKELVFYEDLLQKMSASLKNEPFCEKIRLRYRAVLIDEFQDTDPIQWDFFSKLFLDKKFKGPMYVVGDPKQSIYNFRGADVYTYLEAKKMFDQSAHATLTRNFRSDSQLVSALNHLFSSPFLFLPKLNQTLDCPEISAGIPLTTSFKDEKKAVHISFVENEKELFSFIEEEISRLKQEEGLSFKDFAVLVKDRYQAARFMNACGLPAFFRKPETFCQMDGFFVLQDLIRAALLFPDRYSTALALRGPLFENAQSWEDEEGRFFHYRQILEEKGIINFFELIVQNSSLCDEELYTQMLFIADYLSMQNIPASRLLDFMDSLKNEKANEEALVANYHEDAIEVMTIHVSKGLEFAIVFPIGLSISGSIKKDFHREENQIVYGHSLEQKAEKMRQLYVACTRAKKRLYLPVIEKEEEATLNIFLKDKQIDKICQECEGISQSKDTIKSFQNEGLKREIPKLAPPANLKKTFSPIFIQSFTSLARISLKPSNLLEQLSLLNGKRGFMDESQKTFFKDVLEPDHKEEDLSGLRADRHKLASQDLFQKSTASNIRASRCHETKIVELPRGRETGNLLHLLLEKIPFESSSNEETLKEFISPFLKNTLLQDHRDQVALLLQQTLSMPILLPNTFCLSQLESSKVCREMEFLFPQNSSSIFKGFIDLFFEFEGGYYLLDYKSNDLGEDYSERNMKRAVKDHQYDLQAAIYCDAIKRYLKIFSLQNSFKGILYVFLRKPAYLFIDSREVENEQ